MITIYACVAVLAVLAIIVAHFDGYNTGFEDSSLLQDVTISSLIQEVANTKGAYDLLREEHDLLKEEHKKLLAGTCGGALVRVK